MTSFINYSLPPFNNGVNLQLSFFITEYGKLVYSSQFLGYLIYKTGRCLTGTPPVVQI